MSRGKFSPVDFLRDVTRWKFQGQLSKSDGRHRVGSSSEIRQYFSAIPETMKARTLMNALSSDWNSMNQIGCDDVHHVRFNALERSTDGSHVKIGSEPIDFLDLGIRKRATTHSSLSLRGEVPIRLAVGGRHSRPSHIQKSRFYTTIGGKPLQWTAEKPPGLSGGLDLGRPTRVPPNAMVDLDGHRKNGKGRITRQEPGTQ